MLDFIHYPDDDGRPFIPDAEILVDNCYHVFSSGTKDDTWFKDKNTPKDIVNALAVSYARCSDARILAYCVMSNHIHLTLHGDLPACTTLMKTFIEQMKRILPERLISGVETTCSEIKDLEYLLTCIAYGDRNPLKGGMTVLPCYYEWSSSNLLFRPDGPSAAPSYRTVGSFMKRDQRKLFHTHDTLPQEWLVGPDLRIWDGNFVDYKTTQKLFGNSPARYLYYLARNSGEMIMRRAGLAQSLFMNDIELKQKILDAIRAAFKKDKITDLSLPERLRLAKDIRRKWAVSFKQLGRILHIKGEDLEELLG